MSVNTSNPGAETVDVDEFTSMLGADAILTPDSGKGGNIFRAPSATDLSFLDEPEVTDPPATTEAAATPDTATTVETTDIDQIIGAPGGEDSEDVDAEGKPKTTGRAKTDKSGLIETFSKLIESGKLFGFEDDKPLDQYSMKDFEELVEANLTEKEKEFDHKARTKFFDSLPDELKYAATYVANGGQDMKGLFRALGHVEEIRALDPAVPEDQARIARSYLSATGYGTPEEIEEEVESWQKAGQLGKKATQFKPKLDAMQKEIVETEVKRQEDTAKMQREAAKAYQDNIISTLKDGELAGTKLDKTVQVRLAKGLTESTYTSIVTGRPTNLLGHLFEQHQYSDKPRFDLIAEATWLLDDPEGYRKSIRAAAANEVAEETKRKLKTEQGRSGAGGGTADTSTDDTSTPGPRRIARPGNIFRRA